MRRRLLLLLLCFSLAGRAPADGPASPDGPGGRARIEGLLSVGRPAEAGRLVDEALRADPANLVLRTLKARCLFDCGSYPRCESVLAEILAGPGPLPPPERRSLLLKLAETRLREDDLDGAAAAVEEALALGAPEEVAGAAGGIFLRARRYRRALPLLDQAVARAPGERFLRYARGVARSKTGDFRGAVEDLAAAERDPSLAAEAGFELGMALLKLGEHRRAVQALLGTLGEDPWQSEAAYQLARALILLK